MNDVFRNGVLNDSKGFCQPFSCKTDVIEINVDSDNVIECGHKQVKNTLLLKQTSASEYSPFDEVVCPDISSVCQISHGKLNLYLILTVSQCTHTVTSMYTYSAIK